MEFESKLKSGVLIRRYKRFLADVRLLSGEEMTIHCPNTGSMKNCQEPGSTVWFTASKNITRKYPHTWQLIETEHGALVGINTGLSNRLVLEAIHKKTVDKLEGYSKVRSEVPYGREKSRIDILLEDDKQGSCYIEVKNVSLGNLNGEGFFPDSVTIRGQKHLNELMLVKESGARAVLFFCVQNSVVESVAPAEEIDPTYAKLLKEAHALGVELMAYRSSVDLTSSTIELDKRLHVVI
tara:strand:+ start:45 stop:758 length:714 start_codon:yes stop_codon:yes gene_type:complete